MPQAVCPLAVGSAVSAAHHGAAVIALEETSLRRAQDLAADLAREHNIEDHDVLFSIAEYKKVSMKYFCE